MATENNTSIDRSVLLAVRGRDLCYVVQATNGGPVKIGHSKDVNARLSEMQCGNPYLLVARALLDGGNVTERSAHKQFDDWRISGEWFAPESIGLICQWLDNNPALVAGGRWSDQTYTSPPPTKAHLRARMRAVLLKDSSLNVIKSALGEPRGDMFNDALKLVRRVDPALAADIKSRAAS